MKKIKPTKELKKKVEKIYNQGITKKELEDYAGKEIQMPDLKYYIKMKNKDLEAEKDVLLNMLATLKKRERHKKLKADKKILSLNKLGRKILESNKLELKKYEEVINNLFTSEE